MTNRFDVIKNGIGLPPESGGLDWIIHPLDQQDFLDLYWDQMAFHIERNETSYFERLNSDLSSANQILLAQFREHSRTTLMHPNGQWSQANCEVYHQGMKSEQDQFESLHLAYLHGRTIVCHLVPAYWQPLAKLMKDVEKESGLVCMANLYLSPRDAQGFTDHTDNKNGFIVQVSGSKRWVLHESSFPNPLRSQRRGRPSEQSVEQIRGEKVFDGVIKAGDTLFLPRGVIHHAHSTPSSPSMHFTISTVQNLEWSDVLIKFVSLFPKNKITETAKDFFEHGLEEAVRFEVEQGSNDWLRASLSPGYYLKGSEELVLLKFRETMKRVLKLMEKRVGSKVGGNMRESMRAAFRLVDTSGAVLPVLLKVIKENQVPLDYIRRLMEEGDTVERGDTAEGVSLQSRMRLTTTAEKLHLAMSSLRDTDALRSAYEFLHSHSEQTFVVIELPSNDPFEKISLMTHLFQMGMAELVKESAHTEF